MVNIKFDLALRVHLAQNSLLLLVSNRIENREAQAFECGHSKIRVEAQQITYNESKLRVQWAQAAKLLL
mgnify:CR=1 FL=1